MGLMGVVGKKTRNSAARVNPSGTEWRGAFPGSAETRISQEEKRKRTGTAGKWDNELNQEHPVETKSSRSFQGLASKCVEGNRRCLASFLCQERRRI